MSTHPTKLNEFAGCIRCGRNGLFTYIIPLFDITQFALEKVIEGRTQYGNSGQQANIIPGGRNGGLQNVGT